MKPKLLFSKFIFLLLLTNVYSWDLLETAYSKLNEISEKIPKLPNVNLYEKVQYPGEQLKKTFSGYGNYLGSILPTNTETIGEKLSSYVGEKSYNGLYSFWKNSESYGETLKSYGQNSANGKMPIFQDVADTWFKSVQNFGSIFYESFETVKGFASEDNVSYLREKTSELVQMVQEHVMNLGERLSDLVYGRNLEASKNTTAQIADDSSLFEYLMENIQSYGEHLPQYLEGYGKKVQEHGTNLKEKLDYLVSETCENYEGSQLQNTTNSLKEKFSEFESQSKMRVGGLVGTAKNAFTYIVQNGGTRIYNGLNIFDKTVLTKNGNPRWFARIDLPTARNPTAHINVNKAISGIKDPHMQISSLTAKTAGVAGKALNFLNHAGRIVMFATVIMDSKEIYDDIKTDSELPLHKVVVKTGTYAGGFYGAGAGAAIGTMIFPGLGTLFGGIVGGAAGGFGGGMTGEFVGEWLNFTNI